MITLPFLALLFTTSFVKNTHAQALEQGNIVVDAYYGFPNLYTISFRALYANSGELNVKTGGLGPLGIRGEYLVTDKIGLGLDLSYNSSYLTFDQVNGIGTTYGYNYKTSKIVAMFCFNYHFLESDKWDFFATTGIGYGNRTATYASNDPSFNPDNVKLESLIPIAAKIGVGLRYFFTDNIGLNSQLSVGDGGIFSIGISGKF